MKQLNLFILLFTLVQSIFNQTVTDIDGNVYNTITIGEQVWMQKNLCTTKLNDDTQIVNITNDASWGSSTSAAYCWNANKIANKDPFGALYNWHVVETGKLCPTGWHVPSQKEWQTLIDYLGGKDIAGKKIKMTGTDYWPAPNDHADNSSNFRALCTGMRDSENGSHFHTTGNTGTGTASFWSSSKESSNKAYAYSIGQYYAAIGSVPRILTYGFSVRCIQCFTLNPETPDDKLSITFKAELNVSIYPNPATEIIQIQGNMPTNTTIQVIDVNGKTLINYTLSTNQIDISHLKTGFYTVRLISSDFSHIQRLLIE